MKGETKEIKVTVKKEVEGQSKRGGKRGGKGVVQGLMTVTDGEMRGLTVIKKVGG